MDLTQCSCGCNRWIATTPAGAYVGEIDAELNTRQLPTFYNDYNLWWTCARGHQADDALTDILTRKLYTQP
jgi:hypothetical protein